MKQLMKWRWVLWLIPFLLGTYGYILIYGNNLLGAMYSALRLYGLDIDVAENQLNGYIQVARWLAVASVISILTMILKNLFSNLWLRSRLQKPDTVVVHGDGVRKEKVLEAMEKTAIPMTSKICFRAKQHVLAFDTDIAALSYLKEYEHQLLAENEEEDKKDRKQVYFLSHDFEPLDYASYGLIVSNSAFNCARKYWAEHWLKDENTCKIGIVGFGVYGQRILEQALLVNVFIRENPIEYHVFGSDGREFLSWRRGLGLVLDMENTGDSRDKLFFHPEEDAAYVEALEKMDRIIITTDSEEENILCLNRMLAFGVGAKIHARSNKEFLKRLKEIFEDQIDEKSLISFCADETLYSAETIMHQKLCDSAKEAHINYVRHSSPMKISTKYASCKNCDKAEALFAVCSGCKDRKALCQGCEDHPAKCGTCEEKANMCKTCANYPAQCDACETKSKMCEGCDERRKKCVACEKKIKMCKRLKCSTYYATCGDCEYASRTWDDLTPIMKASNLAAADHLPVKKMLLENVPWEDEKFADGDLYKDLLKVEHERWMRFYLLRNTKYGEKRDDIKRIHPCLKPFDQLSSDEQKQDWYLYQDAIAEIEKDREEQAKKEKARKGQPQKEQSKPPKKTQETKRSGKWKRFFNRKEV